MAKILRKRLKRLAARRIGCQEARNNASKRNPGFNTKALPLPGSMKKS